MVELSVVIFLTTIDEIVTVGIFTTQISVIVTQWVRAGS